MTARALRELIARVQLDSALSLSDEVAHEEGVQKTSFLVILSGFLLILGVVLLAALVRGARGEKDGKPDVFGMRVTVKEVAAKYQLTWSPRGLCPGKSSKKPFGSPIYSVMWIFLMLWTIMAGIFLVIAGAMSSIENFRNQQHLIAAGCVAFALLLCGLWTIIFRLGSLSPKQIEELEADIKRLRADEVKAGDAQAVPPSAPIPVLDEGKKPWLIVALVMLLVAWIAVVVAIGSLRPWTLPGEQYGTLIFLGPGYGLLGGWLAFAASLNYGIVVASGSYPDGVREKPTDAPSRAYPASWVPAWWSVAPFLVAVIAPDPAHPLPTLIALLLFTPKYRPNLVAAAVCAAGIGIGVWRVIAERDALHS